MISPSPFCLTLDTDWASDYAIAYTLELICRYGIKPTVFATNESQVLRQYIADDKIEIGLHPNFLPGSTHGDNYIDVIDHLVSLYPEAKTYRSHAYFDNWHISAEMFKRGIKYDANLCLYLQEGLTPLQHATGLLRFPTFWEDGVFFFHKNEQQLTGSIKKKIYTPGLKVFAFHPTTIFFNFNNIEAYNKLKHTPRTIGPEHECLRGIEYGAQNFLIDILENFEKHFVTLENLFNKSMV